MADSLTSDNNVVDISQVRFNSVVIEDAGSRASSFYEEGEGNVAACSFQSIWSRLCVQDLSVEKNQAGELIDQAQSSKKQTSSRRISYCICGSSKHDSSAALRPSVLRDEQLTILALSKVPYSDTNPLHWELLCSFYKHIIDARRQNVPRYGSHWEKVGFQGEDPATDLRGVGVFGLCQLLFLVSNGLSSHMTAQLFELSNDKVHNFPFAAVGLNFTMFILERVKTGKLNQLAMKENSFVSVVNGIYRGCFILFYRIWKGRNCTVIDFSTIANEIKKVIKQRPKKLLNMAVLRE